MIIHMGWINSILYIYIYRERGKKSKRTHTSWDWYVFEISHTPKMYAYFY